MFHALSMLAVQRYSTSQGQSISSGILRCEISINLLYTSHVIRLPIDFEKV